MSADPIAETRRWIERVVIGLNLCPFARRVFDAGRIRFLLSAAHTEAELLDDLTHALSELIGESSDVVETTILIHPEILHDFLDYNDFLARADERLAELDLVGEVQIASFHPRYQFAGTQPGAVENATNQSPYPMLHLLREESITRVAGDPEFLAGIPQRNIETLRRLGWRRVKALTSETSES